MKLRCAWESVTQKADKSNGKADVELAEHLKVTGQQDLMQAEILQECLDMLKDEGLIEEAYLRGSLGRGHGDEHSDIDLFAVVDPAHVETVYDKVNAYLEQKGGIITSCHDRLVEDYGGIGFMLIAEHGDTGQVFQFDLYMAIKGVPPKNEVSIKPRMYSKDPEYKWLDEYGQPRDLGILPDETKDFIKKHTEGNGIEDRLELIMQELLISVFVAHKHIKRGQTSRTVIDNHSVTTSAIEMLQELTHYRSTGYSAIYLGNEVVTAARKYGDEEMAEAADRLEKFFTQPIDDDKLRDIVAFGKDVLKKAAPEKYEQQKKAIELFETRILAANENKAQPAPRKPKQRKHAP